MTEPKRIPREKTFGEPRHYVLDKNTPPIVEIEPGEKIICEIEDSLNGVLRDRPDRLYPRDAEPASTMVPAWINPLCGPIYVKGVAAGDVLVVNIEKIDQILNGVIITVPGWHHFAGLRGWEECDEMYTGAITNKDGRATWKYESHTHTWDLKPFLGTIATAPEFEVLSTLATSFGSALAAGGNLDCRDVRAGAKVYLQSFNEGGLLSFGDPHASQGDGEICSVANEAAAEVTLSCDVIKDKTLNNVRLETPESLISVYCYRPVEEAIKQAMKDLVLWLEEEYGMTKREAYLLSSICPGFKINIYQCCGNLGRLMTTVGAEFPKDMIPK